ncbi:hypothetical protein [Spirochaeta dissipatitropha]
MRRMSILLVIGILLGSGSVVFAQTETSDGNPIPANMWFGASGAFFSGFDTEPIGITQLRDDYNHTSGDSIILGSGVSASVNPEDSISAVAFEAGLGLGWFPGFTAFQLENGDYASVGTMFNLSGFFGDGFGFLMSAAPEVNYQKGRLAIHAGVNWGVTLMFKTLGDFNLEGADSIIVRADSLDGCSEADFEGDNIRCRRHTDDSTVRVTGMATVTSPYLNFMYITNEEDNSGFGLTVGYNIANNSPVTYSLRGSKDTENELNGPEFEDLSNSFDFSGVYVRLSFISRPLRIN